MPTNTPNKKTLPSMLDSLTIDLCVSVSDIESLINARVRSSKLQAELVLPGEVRAPKAYRRFQRQEEKDDFRQGLMFELSSAWRLSFGEEKAVDITRGFESLSLTFEENGALVFGDFITRDSFQLLVSEYDKIMREAGSLSLLHSYVDLRNHPRFLADEDFNNVFIHPLLVALIAYRVGGPIRIVDARGKDAQPLTARAQDNMLHIDNTPFNDEYKVLLTWERGKASGPKGQNFVFLPGTHKGARNCFVTGDKKAGSTENASIFTTDRSMEEVFEFQKKVLPTGMPTIIEVEDRDRPLTTVFAAGSLVHHRYRTEKGYARSSLIIAFHPASDNPGRFLDGTDINEGRDICRILLGHQDATTGRDLMRVMIRHAEDIGLKISEILTEERGTVVIDQEQKILALDEIEQWKVAVASAPEIEDIKRLHQKFPLGQKFTIEEFITVLADSMMFYDKHGPLDLILYEDNHEESRKWARNRIREMRLDYAKIRLRGWVSEIRQPQISDAVSPEELVEIARHVIHSIDSLNKSQRHSAVISDGEKISSENSFQSTRQLIEDLGEAIVRCYSIQNFLSTSLFLFWSCDQLCQLLNAPSADLTALGGKLLRNYIATAILTHLADEY